MFFLPPPPPHPPPPPPAGASPSFADIARIGSLARNHGHAAASIAAYKFGAENFKDEIAFPVNLGVSYADAGMWPEAIKWYSLFLSAVSTPDDLFARGRYRVALKMRPQMYVFTTFPLCIFVTFVQVRSATESGSCPAPDRQGLTPSFINPLLF